MNPASSHNSFTYSDYLRLPELLSLQHPKSPQEHDEMLFIVIHQAYELWFKQLLHETDYLKTHLLTANTPKIFYTLKRIRSILKLIVSQMDVLETMTTFAKFRPYLGTSSGFQSVQFRELEHLLGFKRDDSLLELFPKGSPDRDRIEARRAEPTIWQSALRFFAKSPGTTPPLSAEEEEALLMSVYQKGSVEAELAEQLLDIDEGLQEWRYRHVKMVERMIGGFTQGTGGSPGAAYLRSTLSLSFCPALWKIRNAALS